MIAGGVFKPQRKTAISKGFDDKRDVPPASSRCESS
jgi:hypothetical protein